MDKFAIRALLQRIAAEQAQQEMGLGGDIFGSGQPREGLSSQNVADASMEAFSAEDPMAALDSTLRSPDRAMADQSQLMTGAGAGMDIQRLLQLLGR